MAVVLLFLLCLPLLFFIYNILQQIIKKKSRLCPPGPLGLPFIGNLHQIKHSSLHTSLWQLSKSYGPIISLRFGFIPTIVVSSASLAKEVLKTQDVIFCTRPSFIGAKKLTYNGLDVAFSPYNTYWREMKKLFILHLLSPKKVQSFRYVRENEVSSAMQKIQGLARLSKQINLSEIAKSVMSIMMLRVGLGKSYMDEHERKKVLRFPNELQGILADLFVSDLWPGLPFVSLVDRLMGKMDRLEKCLQVFDLFNQELINERLNPEKSCGNGEEEDFIDILLHLKKDKQLNFTDDHIKGLLNDVLVAGTDTSAATVIWAMTFLMKNPKVMKKIQEEVRNVVGNKGKIDEDDLPNLIYLKAVVKESMRLYPSGPLLVPREAREDAILNGYEIKKNTLIFVNAFAIGRDPVSWENPEEFLPERFMGSNIDFRGNDFEFIPFGAGRRICPGILMGVLMVELVLANLVYLFDWVLPDGLRKEAIDVEAVYGLAVHKRNDLFLLAHEYL